MHIKKYYGLDTWDLYYHFVDSLRYYSIGDASYWFEGNNAFLGRMEVPSTCLQVLSQNEPPKFVVAVGDHGYEFGLSYGWEGATFHQHNAWQIDKWRQDLSESELHTESDIFTYTQLTSVEEVARAVQKQLDRLFQKLGYYLHTGLYRLEWEEMAALMRSVQQQYQTATDLHEQLAGPDHDEYLGSYPAYLAGRRQGVIQLALPGRFDKIPLKLEASRDEYGWRLDLFSPYGESQGDCPWMFCVMFGCEDRPYETWQVRCPLPHSTPHTREAKWVDVWDLKRFLFEEYLPKVVGEISHFKQPRFGLFY